MANALLIDLHPLIKDIGFLVVFVAALSAVAWYLSRKGGGPARYG